MKTLKIFIAVIACLMVTGIAYADVWGVRAGTQGNEIININPFTGVVSQSFAAPNFAAANTRMGLAGWTSELFYTNTDSENDKVYVIDPTNGSTLNSFTVDGGWEIDGLGYWSNNVADYLYTSGCVVDDVHRYNAVNGADPFFYWSDISNPLTIAGDNGGRVFAVGANATGRFGVWEMDPLVDVAGTFFANSPVSNIVGGAFDGTYLYLSDTSGSLYTLDNSGNLINTLALGYNLYALASTEGVPSVPEPGTLLLISTGLAGFAAMRRRMR